MAKTTFLDPNFYFLNDHLSYSIRGEVVLKEAVDGTILQHAVDKAFERFPYFSVQVIRDGEEYVLVSNPRPHNIIHTKERLNIGTEEVNYHLVVVSYYENKICFNVAHSVTDGAGRAPLTKSVLYYYVTEKYGVELSTDGVYLAGQPLFDDETGIPMPYEEIMKATDALHRPVGDAYQMLSSGLINDSEQREYRFKVSEKEFMSLNKSNDASPSVLASVLLAKILWKLDSNVDKNIVGNLCVNMRPGLHNKHSKMPLFTCIPLTYKPTMKDMELAKLCTCTRGMVMLQSDEENIKYLYKSTILGYEALNSLPDLKTKREVASNAVYGKEGLLSATFLVSYVGKSTLGDLNDYVHAMFTTVDAIPKGGIIIEITSGDGDFYFTFMQDFSSDVYFREFTKILTDNGMHLTMISDRPILAPVVKLPE